MLPAAITVILLMIALAVVLGFFWYRLAELEQDVAALGQWRIAQEAAARERMARTGRSD